MSDTSGFGSFAYDDGSTHLAEHKKMVLDFYHIPSATNVVFKAMINSFSDEYKSEWNTEAVYGRMDPIGAFQGTARSISVEWDVVAASIDEAKLNMAKAEKLMAMLYPSYAAGAAGSAGGAQTIASSPLFKFKFGNFAHSAMSDGIGGAPASADGLVGFIGGFTFEPDFDSGIVDPGVGEFYPLKLTLSAEFTVLHTHAMGWSVSKAAEEGGDAAMGRQQAGFPYNTGADSGGGASSAGGAPPLGDPDDPAGGGIPFPGLGDD